MIYQRFSPKKKSKWCQLLWGFLNKKPTEMWQFFFGEKTWIFFTPWKRTTAKVCTWITMGSLEDDPFSFPFGARLPGRVKLSLFQGGQCLSLHSDFRTTFFFAKKTPLFRTKLGGTNHLGFVFYSWFFTDWLWPWEITIFQQHFGKIFFIFSNHLKQIKTWKLLTTPNGWRRWIRNVSEFCAASWWILWGHAGDGWKLYETYCWWFRNPANQWISGTHYLQGKNVHPNGGCFGISFPSAVSPWNQNHVNKKQPNSPKKKTHTHLKKTSFLKFYELWACFFFGGFKGRNSLNKKQQQEHI